MNKDKQKRININQTTLYGLLVFILVLALGIAYAQVISQTLEVEGEAGGNAQQGVFITDVEYYTDTGADTANSSVDYFLGTVLSSKVTLGSSSSSSYTYKVTMYNGTDRQHVFIGVLTDGTENTYSNSNIEYSLESIGDLSRNRRIHNNNRARRIHNLPNNI